MTEKRGKKFNNKKGFTLAELLIVLAITSILLGIAMVGLLHYANLLKQTEMDNTAKEIFVAAQNHLTTAEGNGQLNEIVKKAEDDPKILGKKMTVKPSDMPSDEWNKNKDDYYYIILNSSSYITYGSEMMKILLPFGAIDEDIRTKGCYVLEYNLETASVYGVFYNNENPFNTTDESTSGGYFNAISSPVRPQDISDSALAEARSNRSSYKGAYSHSTFPLGYYGGAMIDLLGKKITMPEVSVTNGEKLEVKIIDPNYFDTAAVKNAETGNVTEKQLDTYINLVVEGTASGNIKLIKLKLSDLAPASDPQKAADSGEFWDVKKITLDDGSYGLEYNVALDNIGTAAGHFGEICDNLIPGEDIVVRAQCSSNKTLTQVLTSEGIYTNSLFSSVIVHEDSNANPTSEATAEISALRHLENLDPDVSNLPMALNESPEIGDNKGTNSYIIVGASQIKDLNFDNFVDSVTNDAGNYAVYEYGETSALATNSYYGIYNENLKIYNGNEKTIRNVNLYNTTTNLKNPGDCNGGMFRYISSSITVLNLRLKDFRISAYKNAAALVAEIDSDTQKNKYPVNVKIENVLIDGGQIAGTLSSGNVGGLVGYAKAYGTITITGSAAAAKCQSASGDVGGLIGEIASPAVIRNSYSGGHTVNGKYSTAEYNVSGSDLGTTGNWYPSAGGFVGKIESASGVSIENCYSTCSAQSKYAGGFVGYDEASATNYKNCYATGLVSGQHSGAFGGYVSGSSFSQTYYLNDINSDATPGIKLAIGISGSVEKAVIGDETTITDYTANRETHNYDQSLGAYPFKMVNDTWAFSSTVFSAHYGDWQEPEIEAVGEGFAYREICSDGKAYYKVLSISENGNSYNVSESGRLNAQKNIYVESYSYGLLLSQDRNLSSVSKGTSARNYYDSAEMVTVGGKIMYFYPVKQSVINSFYGYNGYLTTPTYYYDAGKSRGVDFKYNPWFANASTIYSWNFGTEESPYEVRTENQFNKIGYSYYAYKSKAYKQSCDIKFDSTNSYTKPVISGEFSGSYSAKYNGDEGYEIRGLRQRISSYYYSTGLFEDSSGTLEYINLADTDITVSTTSPYIAAIVAYNSGNLINCNVKDDVKIDIIINSYTSANMYIGGIIGVSTENNIRVDNCKSSGKIKFYFSNQDSYISNAHIGGFIGYSSSYFTSGSEVGFKNCNSEAEIEVYPNGGSSNFYIGGFIGYLYGGDLEYCSSKAIITNHSSSGGGNEFIGGFAAVTNGRSSYAGGYTYSNISKSFSRSEISNSSNRARVGGFVGRPAVNGTNSSEFKNCYAVTDLSHTTASYNGSSVGLFAGIDENLFGGTTSANYYNCHAAQKKTSISDSSADKDAILLSGYGFINAQYNIGSGRYSYVCSSKGSTTGITALSVAAYKTLAAGGLANLDTTIWEVTNGNYPTLKDNPEN